MQPREWTPPAIEPAKGPAAAPAQASAPSPHSQWGTVEYLVSFMSYMLFFGVIAGLFRSAFPINLGLFLFFTNDGLIEWVLRKAGIRLVPDSLGATFVKPFVWVSGASILLTHWKDSAPAWLSSWLPPPNAPWSFLACAALGSAVPAAVSTAFVRRVLPWLGIKIARDSLAWRLTEGFVGFATLGLMFLLLSMPVFSDWLGGH
jgi:hypothetical protein